METTSVKEDLGKWRSDREKSAALARAESAAQALEESASALARLQQPWFAAIHDQVDATNITQGEFVRLLDICEQNGMEGSVAARALDGDEGPSPFPEMRRISAMSFQMSEAGISKDLVTRAVRYFILPFSHQDEKERGRVAMAIARFAEAKRAFGNDGQSDPPLPLIRVQGEMEEALRNLPEDGYLQRMASVRASLQSDMAQAQSVMAQASAAGVSENDFARLAGAIQAASVVPATVAKPAYAIDEGSLGNPRKERENVALARHQLTTLLQTRERLARFNQYLNQIASVEDPEVLGHLLHDVDIRFGRTGVYGDRDASHPVLGNGFRSLEAFHESITKDPDSVLFDPAARTSPVVQEILPEGVLDRLQSVMSPDHTHVTAHQVAIFKKDQQLLALGLGLEAARWETDVEGNPVRNAKPSLPASQEKFWAGFWDGVNRTVVATDFDTAVPQSLSDTRQALGQAAAKVDAKIQELEAFVNAAQPDPPAPDATAPPSGLVGKVSSALGWRRKEADGHGSGPDPASSRTLG